MDSEKFIVSLGRNQIPLRRQQLDSHQRRCDGGDSEKDQDRPEIENADPLVVGCKQPRANAVIAQVIHGRHLAFGANVDFRRASHFRVELGGSVGPTFPAELPPIDFKYAMSCMISSSLN